jgi:hypothetical protein
MTGCLKGDHQYSCVRGLCDGLIRRSRKNTDYEIKRRKMGQITLMNSNSKRRKDLRLDLRRAASKYKMTVPNPLKPDKDLDREVYYLRCSSMSCWKVSYDKQTYKETQISMYADDIVGRSQSAVRDAYLALAREAAKVRLKINEQKTKYMIVAQNVRPNRDVRQSVAIGDKHFEVVKEFVNLGSLMAPTNDVSLEIQRRIQTANRCFFGLRIHLQSSHLSRQTKFTIHKTLIRPVLLYGSETWVLTKREENQLHVFERKVHRMICDRKSKMVSTGEGTTTNSIKSLSAQIH